jgi:hypothetical protein
MSDGTAQFTTPKPSELPGRPDRRFYSIALYVAAAIVFAGFARSYFLKVFFDPQPFYPMLHVHGLVMTSWFLLFGIQTWLIEKRHVRAHRRLGVFGAALAIAILVVGTTVVIIGGRAGDGPPGVPIAMISLISLANFLAYGVLVAAAVAFRANGGTHKRLMLVATANLLSAAIQRIPLHFIQAGGLISVFGSVDLFIICCMGYDAYRHRRLHPAFVWSLVFTVVWPALTLWFGKTALWGRWFAWLIS